MNSTIVLVIISIVVLMLLLPLLFFLRRRVVTRLKDDILILEYPLSTRQIDLANDLQYWEVQETYYLRWGMIYSIRMVLKSGKSIVVSSMLNKNNYDQLSTYLHKKFLHKRKADR